MLRSAAARRYARALFALAREGDAVEATRDELDAMAELLDGNAELTNALFRPIHPLAERRSVLRALCERMGASETIRKFYGLLVERRRLVDFAAIREEFARLADTAAGCTRASIVTASPLTETQIDRLRRALAARTGRRIELSARVDPSLIAGAVAAVDGLVFDGSLRTQLAQLRVTLTRGHRADGHQAG